MLVDTLSIARELKESKLSIAQAEAIAAAIGRSVSDNVPSKVDLDQVRGGLELKIEQLRTEVERTRNQVLVGFVSTQIAFAGIIIAAVKLL